MIWNGQTQYLACDRNCFSKSWPKMNFNKGVNVYNLSNWNAYGHLGFSKSRVFVSLKKKNIKPHNFVSSYINSYRDFHLVFQPVYLRWYQVDKFGLWIKIEIKIKTLKLRLKYIHQSTVLIIKSQSFDINKCLKYAFATTDSSSAETCLWITQRIANRCQINN